MEYRKEEYMNKVVLMGRLTSDPAIHYTSTPKEMCIARYTLAVDRKIKQEGGATADFINCVAFGKLGEHCEKYYRKGLRVIVSGRIQTGNYTNKDGVKVYTTDVVIEEQEFAESKAASDRAAIERNTAAVPPQMPTNEDGFMSIPDGIDEELPFN